MEIHANKGKIFVVSLIRFIVLAVFFIGLYASGGDDSDFGKVFFCAIVTFALLFILSPLRHLNEVFILAPGKITFKKKEFTFSDPAEIKWARYKTYFIGTRLRCYKGKEKTGWKEVIFSSFYEMDLTYLKNPHEEFINYYMNGK